MHKRKGSGARQRSYQERIPAAIRFARGPQKLVTILCVLCFSLAAQWPNRPTPGIPRAPNGEPDLCAAPAPRSAAGKPDLSGVWLVKNENSYLAADLKLEDMRPWAAALYKQREDNFRRDTDGIACLPPGPKAGIGVGGFR